MVKIAARKRREELAYFLWLKEGKPHGRDKQHWEQAGKSKVSVEADTDSGSDEVELSTLKDDRPVFLCTFQEFACLQLFRYTKKRAFDEIIHQCDAEIFAGLEKAS